MGGDGLISAVAGELRHTDGVLAVLPGGRGNDFARKLGLGCDPVAACRRPRRRARAAHRRRRHRRPRLPRDRELGPRLRRRRPRQRHAPEARPARLRLRDAARASRAWRPARWEVVIDGAARSFTGYSVAVANSGVFGGGMYLAPERQARRRPARRRDDRRPAQAHLPRRRSRRSSPAPTSASPGVEMCQAREVAFHADRPFNVQADGDPIADLPATVRVQPGRAQASSPHEPARPQAGRGEGRRRARPPRRPRRRDLAARQGAHAPRAARDRAAGRRAWSTAAS